MVGGRRKHAFAAVGVWGKVGITTYDLPGVYINTRIKHASPPNLFLSFLHFSRWDSSMYMSLYTFLQSWEPTNRTSLSGGGVYTVSVLVASCGPRDALTYGSRAFPVSMTKVSKKISTFVPSGQGPTGRTFRALRCMAILRLSSSVALSWWRRHRIFCHSTHLILAPAMWLFLDPDRNFRREQMMD